MTTSAPLLRRIQPPTLATPPGYSHVVEVRSGRTVYTAGQVALDREGKLVGEGDMRAQIEQVFANVGAALEAAGTDFAHVVKLTTFVTDAKLDNLLAFRDVRDRHVAPQHAPASTLVQVARLARPEWLVEIDATAVLSRGPGERG